jgi:hypothetical protein
MIAVRKVVLYFILLINSLKIIPTGKSFLILWDLLFPVFVILTLDLAAVISLIITYG